LGAIPHPRALTPSEFKKAAETAYIVDTRTAAAFGAAHIKGAFSLVPKRLSNVGWIAEYSKPILLVVDDLEALDFAVRNLVRLGLDNIVGYLRGGVEAWYKEGYPLAKAGLVTVHDLKTMIDSKEKIRILDVRRANEWVEGHIEGSTRIYLGHVPEQVNQLPRDLPIVVVCKTGNRSSFGVSVLLKARFDQVYNCLGGIEAWIKSGYPVTRTDEKT